MDRPSPSGLAGRLAGAIPLAAAAIATVCSAQLVFPDRLRGARGETRPSVVDEERHPRPGLGGRGRADP